jgi:hypothetical protein
MHITTPSELTNILWEGALAPVAEMKTMRGDDALIASIGQPAQWADGQLLGDKWQPPVGGGRYHLLRLAFSLRSSGRTVVSEADFCLRLQGGTGGQAVVFDAFPLEQTVPQDRSMTVGLSPKLKLTAVEAELGKAEATIDLGRVIPVVRGTGLAEPVFCWRFTAHARYPLAGSRWMVAVVHLPAGTPWAAATLELSATVETRFGPIRLTPPQTAWQQLRYQVG